MTRTGIVAAFLAGVLALGGGAGTAAAAVTATATVTTATTSGSWSAVLVDGWRAESTGAPLTLSWVFNVPLYVSVRNNGTLPLTGQTYTLTKTGGLTAAVTAYACVGGTWILGACSGGTQVQLASTSTAPATAAVPLAPGASVPIKVTNPLGFATTVTLGVSTVRANTRPATTTSS